MLMLYHAGVKVDVLDETADLIIMKRTLQATPIDLIFISLLKLKISLAPQLKVE